MKEFLTIKNVLIIVFAIYLIIVVERLMQTPDKSEILIEYQLDKIEMQKNIISLTNKVNSYEKSIMQNSLNILSMSKSERDSARVLFNPR